MDPSTLSIIGIVLSLAFIVVFALRGWHIIILAPLAVIFVSVFSGLDILPTLMGPYMKGFVSYAGKFYLIFLMGSLFGKVMEDSGAARAIAEGILKVVGRGNPMNGVMAIALIGVALTYGGVSLFVVIFALIPIGRPIFKELDLPWHLFVIPYAFSIGSITMTMMPGSPQILNIMPTKYMASSTMSAPCLASWARLSWRPSTSSISSTSSRKPRHAGKATWPRAASVSSPVKWPSWTSSPTCGSASSPWSSSSSC